VRFDTATIVRLTTGSPMHRAKPQHWTRDYVTGITLRIDAEKNGLWHVSGDGVSHRESLPELGLQTMQLRADDIAGARPAGPWHRVCATCGCGMIMESRNRPDSGPDGERGRLWVCSSRACGHAEPADE
jgi:hypothetical protein